MINSISIQSNLVGLDSYFENIDDLASTADQITARYFENTDALGEDDYLDIHVEAGYDLYFEGKAGDGAEAVKVFITSIPSQIERERREIEGWRAAWLAFLIRDGNQLGWRAAS